MLICWTTGYSFLITVRLRAAVHFKLPCCNWVTTEFSSLEVWPWIPSLIYQILLGASIGNFTQWNIQAHFTGPWPWPHLLFSRLSIARALRPANAHTDWKLPTVPKNGVPTRWGFMLICETKRNALPSAEHGLFTATSAMCCHSEGHTDPPSAIPLFLLLAEPIFKANCANW